MLFDENSNRLCLSILNSIDLLKSNTIRIVIPAGERHKNIETVQYIWSQLIENQADRKSLLINVGGGMVTDIGGFAASC
jgi:3-dehydroquinate synthase